MKFQLHTLIGIFTIGVFFELNILKLSGVLVTSKPSKA